MRDLSTTTPATEVQTAVTNPPRPTTLFMWLAVVLILGLSGWGLLNSSKVRPEAGQPAPDFAMQFFDGYQWQEISQASLSDLRGQVVVLNFWASWCVECRLEANLLEQRWQQYRDQGVVFLGIAYVDAEPNSLAYLQEFAITYPNAPDLGSDIAQDYEITGVPETFFIGRDGQIAHVQIGPVTEEVLDTVVGQLLNKE